MFFIFLRIELSIFYRHSAKLDQIFEKICMNMCKSYVSFAPPSLRRTEQWTILANIAKEILKNLFRKNCKGQLISKCLFGVFTFFQTTNENKSTSSKVKFVRSFFGRNIGLKKSFQICLTFTKSIEIPRIFLWSFS